MSNAVTESDTVPAPSRVTEWRFPVVATFPTRPGGWIVLAERTAAECPNPARRYVTWFCSWEPGVGYLCYWGTYDMTREAGLANFLQRAGLRRDEG